MKQVGKKAVIFFILTLVVVSLLACEVYKWDEQGYGHFLSLNGEHGRHLLLRAVYSVVVAACLFSIFTILFIIFFIILHHLFFQLREQSRIKAVQHVHNFLFMYLYQNQERALMTLRRLDRALLAVEIATLQKQIIGERADQLYALFYLLQLDSFVIRKIRKGRWPTKIKYMEVAQWMLVYPVTPFLDDYRYSSKPALRHAAQVTSVALDVGNAFAFLNMLEHPIPMWNQIILHRALVKHSMPIPHFYRFLGSSNASVVLFSLQMIRLFKQRGDETLIIKLINHSDPVIRRTAILVIWILDIKDAEKSMQKRFLGETLRNQINIVAVLESQKIEERYNFYMSIWDKTPRKVRVEILKNVSTELRQMLMTGLNLETCRNLKE